MFVVHFLAVLSDIIDILSIPKTFGPHFKVTNAGILGGTFRRSKVTRLPAQAVS